MGASYNSAGVGDDRYSKVEPEEVVIVSKEKQNILASCRYFVSRDNKLKTKPEEGIITQQDYDKSVFGNATLKRRVCRRRKSKKTPCKNKKMISAMSLIKRHLLMHF